MKNKSESVDGLLGINKQFTGKNFNHINICELKLLGKYFNSSKKEIEKYCLKNLKYKQMEPNDYCSNCPHIRLLCLTDDGNHINGIL